jgi:hypothetical protein
MNEADLGAYFPFEVSGPIEYLDFGRIKYHVLWIPDELKPALGLNPTGRLRIEAEIGEFGWQAAISPAGGGRHFVILSADCLKANGVQHGSPIELRFRIVEPDLVVIPAELERILKVEQQALAVWEGLTAGKRRGLCHRVESAKRAETRLARAREVLAFLEGRGPDPSLPKRTNR